MEFLPFDPAVDRPEVLYLSLPASDICNYRCRHCHIWMQQKRSNLLSRRRRLELIEEFAVWNPGGTIVVPGGEVTLELDELLPVAGLCKKTKLPLILLTNGSRIDSAVGAEELVTSGLTHIVVSLDGATKELHDYTRGVVGAFESTLRAIELLVTARDQRAPDVAVMVACVLFKGNLEQFPDLVELCRKLGVNHVDCQLLARTFANQNPPRDAFFDKHFWHQADEKLDAQRQLERILERYSEDPFVVKSLADLEWMSSYIGDPDFEIANPVCGSHQRNLLIDSSGNGALCFNAAAILERPFVGDAHESSLQAIWQSQQAAAARRVMDGCRLNCGALNCHRRKAASA